MHSKIHVGTLTVIIIFSLVFKSISKGITSSKTNETEIKNSNHELIIENNRINNDSENKTNQVISNTTESSPLQPIKKEDSEELKKSDEHLKETRPQINTPRYNNTVYLSTHNISLVTNSSMNDTQKHLNETAPVKLEGKNKHVSALSSGNSSLINHTSKDDAESKELVEAANVIFNEGGDVMKTGMPGGLGNDKHISTTKKDNHIISKSSTPEIVKLTTSNSPKMISAVKEQPDIKPIKEYTLKPGNTSHKIQSEAITDTINKVSTDKLVPVKKKKPLFTMVTGDRESKDSESFIESPTTGRDYVLPIVLAILSLPIAFYIIKLIYRRGTEFTERQQYHRMYLIDGMYNSR